jgi:HSP20 family protein
MTTLLNSIASTLNRAAPAAQDREAQVRPVYQVREDTLGYDVTVQLPGVAKDGLEVSAQENEVTITGRRAWTAPAEWTSLYRETPRANFGLTLAHEGDVDAEKITAELKDGVLRLTLPKAEAAKPRKVIVS